MELRRKELEIAKELKKPNEDMCLADHKVFNIIIVMEIFGREIEMRRIYTVPSDICNVKCLHLVQYGFFYDYHHLELK